MQIAGKDTRVVHQWLVIHVQRPPAGGQRHIAELDIYPAFRYDSAVGRRRIVPVAVNKAGAGRGLYNFRTVELRNVKVAQCARRYINDAGYGPESARIGMEYPRHIKSARGYCLGYLHEHADNTARPAFHPEHVAEPAPVELDVGP
jgi:hypothetical protein